MAKEINREENKDPAFIKLIDDLNNTASQNPVSVQEGIGQALKSVERLDNFPNLGATVKEALNLEAGTRICTIICGYSDQGVAGIVTDNSIDELLEITKRFPGAIDGIAGLLAALARSSGGAS